MLYSQQPEIKFLWGKNWWNEVNEFIGNLFLVKDWFSGIYNITNQNYAIIKLNTRYSHTILLCLSYSMYKKQTLDQ